MPHDASTGCSIDCNSNANFLRDRHRYVKTISVAIPPLGRPVPAAASAILDSQTYRCVPIGPVIKSEIKDCDTSRLYSAVPVPRSPAASCRLKWPSPRTVLELVRQGAPRGAPHAGQRTPSPCFCLARWVIFCSLTNRFSTVSGTGARCDGSGLLVAGLDLRGSSLSMGPRVLNRPNSATA
jgi:hypothetical protein